MEGLALCSLLLLCAGGCDEPSWWHTEKAIVPICERVLGCGGWGWADQGECQAGLLGNPALGTSCADESGFLGCVHDCCFGACRSVLGREACRDCQPPGCNQCSFLDCAAFSACESDCRSRACTRE